MSGIPDSLPTCNTNLVPLVSIKGSPFTPRRALDSSGRLGSFYDACCDQVLAQSNLRFTRNSGSSSCLPHLYVEPYNSEESRNLLKWHQMHRELQLSVALHMTQKLGVGALINYTRPIDKYTRFVGCTHYAKTEYIPDAEFYRLKQNKTPMTNTTATHIIVLVNWGIDAVAILQLPHDDRRVSAIDQVIEKLCRSQHRNEINGVLLANETILEQIDHIEIFSNIPELCQMKSIKDFHRTILKVSNDHSLLKPYNYSLCSIETLYDMRSEKQGVFIELYPNDAEIIGNQLLHLVRTFDKLGVAMDQSYQNVKDYLEDRFSDTHAKWHCVYQMYIQEIERLRELVMSTRRGFIRRERINEALNDDRHNNLQQSINDFEYDLSVIQEKEDFIQALLHKDLGYQDAKKYDIQHGDDLETVKQKLFKDGKADCFILFNDNLLEKKKAEWHDLVDNVMKECSEHRSLQIIVVDFSFCTYELNDFSVVQRNEEEMVNTASSTIATTLKPTAVVQPNDGTINILLLGESGVGKSTFINAFANYLAFDTLQQAQLKPHVLIPVSFLTTVGDDFEEKQVKFGEQDDSKNEDYSQPGQSVTQHCKSYPFTLRDDENKERKLCLIDTPGFGDVRGLAQDDINMQHILSHLNNLSHLSGVCLLMKPTNARLNIYFRSCFVQLFGLLGESIRDRMMFCFTNARSTFYTPGNSAPLIKQLLKSPPMQDIRFDKTNTFCFDSESFRYLVARQNGIEFDPSAKQDYQDSWEKSSTESKRLLQYIDSKLTL